jgi:DMSO/TMAO reductase YedYZ molybdopterin-dependent catalytic subunit
MTDRPPQTAPTRVTRGFVGRRASPDAAVRLPPGQHLVRDFPVLSAGPTPRIRTEAWRFTLKTGPRALRSWTWAEFNALPQTDLVRDIHCVTTWSKFDTRWGGVLVDDLFEAAGLEPPTPYVLAHSFDGYSTNVPVADLIHGKAMVALRYDGKPLDPDHGGPARLLVPHLYFWKSAKWVSGLQFTERDEAGFWELRGYNIYGDPWREQRYANE